MQDIKKSVKMTPMLATLYNGLSEEYPSLTKPEIDRFAFNRFHTDLENHVIDGKVWVRLSKIKIPEDKNVTYPPTRVVTLDATVYEDIVCGKVNNKDYAYLKQPGHVHAVFSCILRLVLTYAYTALQNENSGKEDIEPIEPNEPVHSEPVKFLDENEQQLIISVINAAYNLIRNEKYEIIKDFIREGGGIEKEKR